MPDRYATPRNPRDFTGNLQNKQYLQHQKEIDADLERQRDEALQTQAMTKPKKVLPVALPMDAYENYIDYTGDRAIYTPRNEPKA